MDVLTPVTPANADELWSAWHEDLRQHCDATSDDDPLLRLYLLAGYARLDGPTGMLGRALLTQTWRVSRRSMFRELALPLPPLQTVDAITYWAGEARALAPAAWEAVAAEPGVVRIRPSVALPIVTPGLNAVVVEFTAGYGDAADLPATVKAAIFAHVATLYENRETSAYGGASFQAAPFTGFELVRDLRVWAF